MHAFPFDLYLFLHERNHEPTPDVNFSATQAASRRRQPSDKSCILKPPVRIFDLAYGECEWVKIVGVRFGPK